MDFPERVLTTFQPVQTIRIGGGAFRPWSCISTIFVRKDKWALGTPHLQKTRRALVFLVLLGLGPATQTRAVHGTDCPPQVRAYIWSFRQRPAVQPPEKKPAVCQAFHGPFAHHLEGKFADATSTDQARCENWSGVPLGKKKGSGFSLMVIEKC